MTKHMENLGIKSLDQKKYEKLLASWKSDINRLNLKIELSPDIDQINFDPVVFMKKNTIYVFHHLKILQLMLMVVLHLVQDYNIWD